MKGVKEIGCMIFYTYGQQWDYSIPTFTGFNRSQHISYVIHLQKYWFKLSLHFSWMLVSEPPKCDVQQTR